MNEFDIACTEPTLYTLINTKVECSSLLEPSASIKELARATTMQTPASSEYAVRMPRATTMQTPASSEYAVRTRLAWYPQDAEHALRIGRPLTDEEDAAFDIHGPSRRLRKTKSRGGQRTT